ncbi:hypothetical protein FQA39_LY04662 [Lamprigera yunnana]|nr:hypothetical protein FQA39_LY04662 [Lamprigera yunnana]
MSLKRAFLVLQATLLVCCALALDEDFGFDVSDDLEVEFPAETPKKLRGITDINAFVGRVFHLAIPKDTFGDTVKSYEAREKQDTPLPSWLLFDKISGVFWGVPLQDDVDTIHISVKAVRQSISMTDEFNLVVSDDNKEPEGTDKCPSTEDSTVLTLIIDKSIKAIKPKQRIIAINNIAKFFGMPYSAFILKPQVELDDITDSSVVLAGPGNARTKTSKDTSFIQVTVGCEGRLWLNSAPIVHQLKQQARDGTISEVIRLPLIGWRVKTESRSLLREKRSDDGNNRKSFDIQLIGFFLGSGDYEEYYEYEDYDEPDKDTDENMVTTPTTPVLQNTHSSRNVQEIPDRTQEVAMTTTGESHPHRHHHGEIRPIGDSESNIPLQETKSDDTTLDIPKIEVKHVLLNTTHVPKQTTPKISPIETTTTNEVKVEKATPISGLYKPSETFESEDEYDDEYDDGNPDDDDDDDIITETPFTNNEIFTNYDHKVKDPVEETNTEIAATESVEKTKTTVHEFITETATTVRATTVEPVTTAPEIITTFEETVTPIMTTTPTTTTTTTTTTTEAPPSTTKPSTTTSATTTTTTPTTTTRTTEKSTVPVESTTAKHTTIRQIAHSATTQRATSAQVTESIVYEVKNFPPTIQIRLKRIVVTAGKNFSQYIPEDMFSDTEDEYNLKLELLTKDGNLINKSFWCQFNPRTREIYGLPLQEDVSRWDFLLRATDTEGASVSERVEIIVQQHKLWRVVTHEFTLYARVERKLDFLNPLDWALHVLDGIGKVFHSKTTSIITVRSVNYATDPMIITWTNDTLQTSDCDKSEIDEIFDILTANEDGDPSLALSQSLAPQLRAKKVTQRLMGICEEEEMPQPLPDLPITPSIMVHPPHHHIPLQPSSNLPPILRNAVDHLNATTGDLLLFRVPDDTFYDPEDVDPNNLKLQLYTADREPLPSDHWLQFDSKNKEFYGVPGENDNERVQYQLVCEDTGGLTASDTLVVEIHPSPKLKYNVEFSMTVEVDINAFARNPSMKRKFVEKLQNLFDDDNANNIHLGSFTKGSSLNKPSTIISWYNKTLIKEECPWNDLRKLESILINNERSMSNHVYKTMGDDFVVIAFRLQHLGVCKIIMTTTTTTTTTMMSLPPTRLPEILVPIEEGAPQESNDDYLVTFIVPAVIISAMLLLAAIAACVLYRRRRSGKMNIEEDGRQSYGNKGIPVIFQEELDEKPESGTKTPVILKDEKPPLAPPEYSKSGSLKLAADDSEPYQPPPPFTRNQDNGRQPRPKPTPTYRKPPPYVPP